MSNFLNTLQRFNIFGGRRAGRTAAAQAAQANMLQQVAEEQRRMNMATATTGTGYWIDEVEQSPEQAQELYNTPFYHYVQANQLTDNAQWFTTTTTAASTLTVDHLQQAQEALTADYIHQTYANGVAIDPAQLGAWRAVSGSFVEEPPKPKPITDFSQWLLKKYNKDV